MKVLCIFMLMGDTWVMKVSKERFVINGSKVLIMGLTYKENVPDTRESPVKEMVKELKEFGVDVYGYDPLLSKKRDRSIQCESFG